MFVIRVALAAVLSVALTVGALGALAYILPADLRPATEESN
jgi:hypothetical protein